MFLVSRRGGDCGFGSAIKKISLLAYGAALCDVGPARIPEKFGTFLIWHRKGSIINTISRGESGQPCQVSFLKGNFSESNLFTLPVAEGLQ